MHREKEYLLRCWEVSEQSQRGHPDTIPNPPRRMVFIALMIMPHKEFGDMVIDLMREKVDIVSHARHHVYTRTKKGRRMIG